MQGVAAEMGSVGDCLIIITSEVTEVPIEPKMILVDQNNESIEYLNGVKDVEQVH